MSARLQAAAAIAMAAGLHLGAFALRPATVGAVSSGAGGEGLVSLQAANASIAEMVEAWDKPPEIEMTPDVTPPQPVQNIQAPELHAARDAPPRLPQVAAPMALPSVADALPEADISLPPPPVVAEEEPDPEIEQALAGIKPIPRPAPPEKAVTKPKPPAKVATPAKKAAPASAARAAQRASGAGGGAQAGSNGTSEAATLSKATLNDLRASWGAGIRTRIERRKTYPNAARGASGTVTVRLTVSRSGQLLGVSLAKSSGNAALDQAAINAVNVARKFKAAPKGLTDSQYSFSLPMRFSR
ncbi:energy transducer TonB [Pacificibacter marinus]|uniref:energy transducer TonB n=1 Tax=Pacificibacter marinus TaxID=658057 RepID=UPI001C071692|nr:TonB family protein [Pacificibacter marinus]MBU2865646.1 TonB family protein [Pacificibacter marinus]